MAASDKSVFCRRFGAVYEHSPWLAERVYEHAMQTGVDIAELDARTLSACFEREFLGAGREQQLAVLRAHPALACSLAATELTRNSQQEQHAAGLDQCTKDELMLFREYNDKYMIKNGYPFIIAVKGRNRADILKCFSERLNNAPGTEFKLALRQVCQIARFRIEAALNV